MSERRHANQPQPAGEIHLRQTAQVQLADQVRTLEIAITLAVGADEDAISRAVQSATAGMHGLTEQLDQHIAALRNEAAIPAISAGNGHPLPALAAPAPPTEASASTAAEAPPESPPAAPAELTMAGFLKAARELGYQPTDIPQALGIASLTGIDFPASLQRLRELAASQPAAAPRGFAEEIGPYDAAEADGVSDITETLADLDEPDFGPVAEEATDGVFTTSTPPETPDLAALQQREAAQRRLKSLRSIRAAGAVATPEQRVALQNLVISSLGRDKAQELIIALWNPPIGEKLNAARTRALVEWAKEDDHFEQTAEQISELARQPATQEG